MLPGFDGYLISSAFIEGQGAALAGAAPIEEAHRRLIAWRTRCGALGPASTPRALFQAAATPVLDALGFAPPTQVGPAGPGLAATLRVDNRTVALLVTPWAEPLDPLWRVAVTEAMRRSASWCILFDGLRLRIVDASRLYARRYVEFDLDLALDHRQSFAALWRTASASALAVAPEDPGSLHALVTASDLHASGVCRSLRDGVLAASGDVLTALLSSRRKVRLPVPRRAEGKADATYSERHDATYSARHDATHSDRHDATHSDRYVVSGLSRT